MENTQYNAGRKSIGSLVKQGIDATDTVGNSERLEKYRAGIARYATGPLLTGPIPQIFNGITYEFDFHAPGDNVLFKVLDRDSITDYPKYLAYPDDLILVVDIAEYDYSTIPVGRKGAKLLAVDGELAEDIQGGKSVYAFSDDQLWALQDRTDTGVTMWLPIWLLMDNSSDKNEEIGSMPNGENASSAQVLNDFLFS